MISNEAGSYSFSIPYADRHFKQFGVSRGGGCYRSFGYGPNKNKQYSEIAAGDAPSFGLVVRLKPHLAIARTAIIVTETLRLGTPRPAD
jgi:hypothetical protein